MFINPIDEANEKLTNPSAEYTTKEELLRLRQETLRAYRIVKTSGVLHRLLKDLIQCGTFKTTVNYKDVMVIEVTKSEIDEILVTLDYISGSIEDPYD